MPDPAAAPPLQKGEIDPFKEVIDSDHFMISETMNTTGWTIPLPNLGGPLNNFEGVLGFQITKFHVLLTIAAFILVMAFVWLGRKMQTGETPRGWLWNFLESIYLYIRDKVARASIGPEGDHYAPFLTTLFLFILIANVLGMIPFMGSPTASIAVTLPLAFIAFVVIHASGFRDLGFNGYIKSFIPHFHMEGAMKYFGIVLTWGIGFLEYLTVFIRFIVLAVRLFANMLAGHVALFVILFFIQLVARPIEHGGGYLLPMQFPEWTIVPVAIFSVLTTTVLSFLELFVAGLQAFIFTLLTAVFIGLAKHPPH